ncbi:hypothetical protein [Elizabethkingia anophelis]|uniref:hypothetical protein n=1 Tax=Elizabethkingia anophelis TaxID=1117645 RepID=UPI001315EF10|nr:hypothetical protein [Elizabethkingia anophelis]MBE9393697.1 hypothetical protein [Elizabethkingia anophelis]MBE9405702.1 hypothetical protein [Elizabethkingia anophelis]BBQ07543.1 hypothetical protein JUNP353_2114 [Elizabethkingia anophelis]
MPHHWGNFLVVTKDELVPKYYNCLNTLQQEIWRYKDRPYGIKQKQKAGNGRKMLIDFDSLPKDIQDSIGDPRTMQHPLIDFFQFDPLAVRYFNDFRFEDGTPLKEQFKEEYITNASVLIAAERLRLARLASWKAMNKTSGRGLLPSICVDISTFNEYLPKLHSVTHTIPQSYRAFDRVWKPFFNTFDEGVNYECLISGKLKNQNRKIMTEDMISLLNDMFAGQEHKPTRTEVARQYKAFLNGELDIISHETGEIYDSLDSKRFKDISDSQIINYLGMWENKIGTHAKRSGDRQKLMQAFIPWHKLEKIKEAGTLISIDDRQPPFIYDDNKNRAWFYMGIDLGSEAWTCWVWGKEKKSIIVEFYRQMVRNYTEWGFNLPLGLECESSLNSSFKDTFLKNGNMFDHVNIYANRARSKAVERKFGELRYRHEKDRIGWMARPFAQKEDNQISAAKEVVIPFDDIIDNSLNDIETWNNMPHSVYTDKTRWEVFCEMQNKNTKPTNWSAFLPYIGREETSSCNAGIINFRSTTYVLGIDGEVALNEDLLRLMKEVEGKQFKIFWLDDNDGEVLKAMIYYNDTMLCDLVPHPTYSRSVHELGEHGEINRNIMSAYENTVNVYMASRKRAIDQVTIIDHRSKTLNNKFQIAGRKRYKPSNDTPKEVTIETEEINYNTSTRTVRGWDSNFR